ncbi:MAG: CHASE3 domain-containing protein [Limisphaerales bacterium]
MKLSIGKKIATGFVLGLIAISVISLVSYRNIHELNSDARWVTHTLEVQQRLQSLYAELLEAQSSARGYEFLADSSFQESFKTASINVNRELQTLRTLTADNQDQQKRLDQLAPMVAIRMETSQKLMDSRQADTENKAQAESLVKEGQKQTEDIHKLLSEMADDEARLLTERQARSAHASELTSSTIIYGTLLAILVVGGIGFFITRSITSPLQVLRDGASKIGGGNYAHSRGSAFQG